jgi:hypothetical protein
VTGRVASMAEIGKHEGLPKNYVSWLIRLAFLAPEIVEAIIQGNHPPDLTAQKLITRRSAAAVAGTEDSASVLSALLPPIAS